MDLRPILQAVLNEYVLPWDGDHGVAHWARVLENGLHLAETTGANTDVIRLFAVPCGAWSPNLSWTIGVSI